jgi:hypothetical protein
LAPTLAWSSSQSTVSLTTAPRPTTLVFSTPSAIPARKLAASARMAATACLIVRTCSANVSSAVAAWPTSVPNFSAAVFTGFIAWNKVSSSGAS